MADATPDLTVRGEPVERVYGNFEDRRYLVNRRYQRKLIWTLEEKRNFIDSVINGYPVPIILLAEDTKRSDKSLEIIDGMQRLDAIVSFIRNGYSVHEHFFDLNTIAVAKALFDSGKLRQRYPIMDRGQCVKIASYLLPLSIYEFSDENTVDLVFRRINSGGRQLSRQELRAAGSVGAFATVVRQISAKVRGDDSYSDILKLNDMQAISITNKDLDYGIDVDSMFWIAHGILSRDQVRQSRDEELVADIVSYMVSEEPISSRTEFLDDFFGMRIDKAGQERFSAIELAVQKRSVDLVISDFQRTLNEILWCLREAEQSFVQLIFRRPASPAPRYFQVIFLAFYELMVKQNLEVIDRSELLKSLTNIGSSVSIQEGGRWGAENRNKTISSVIGVLQKAFAPADVDPAQVHWISQFQNLLRQSFTEQAVYDFKQGFLLLDGSTRFDQASFDKIMKTCVAISNIKQNRKGYVVVGVVEDAGTASRIQSLFAIECEPFDRFYVSGVEHEAAALQKSLDQFYQFIVNKVSDSGVSEPLRAYITSNIKPIRYYEKTVYIFEVIGQEQPSLYKDQYYERSGAQVVKVESKNFPAFYKRYTA